jgi:hypothetical protein
MGERDLQRCRTYGAGLPGLDHFYTLEQFKNSHSRRSNEAEVRLLTSAATVFLGTLYRVGGAVPVVSWFRCSVGAVRRMSRAAGSTLQEFRTLPWCCKA